VSRAIRGTRLVPMDVGRGMEEVWIELLVHWPRESRRGGWWGWSPWFPCDLWDRILDHRSKATEHLGRNLKYRGLPCVSPEPPPIAILHKRALNKEQALWGRADLEVLHQ
jgi:hypothetical protein